jgi:hypothetical protein
MRWHLASALLLLLAGVVIAGCPSSYNCNVCDDARSLCASCYSRDWTLTETGVCAYCPVIGATFWEGACLSCPATTTFYKVRR